MWWHTRRNQIWSFMRNGRVHLNQRGRQFSRLLAAEVCTSAVVMLDTPCSEVAYKTTGYPLHSPVSPSLPLPCVTVCHHVSTGLYRFLSITVPILVAVLRRRSAVACRLRLWVRIPPGAWMFVVNVVWRQVEVLCDELITRPEESYRLQCVAVCDLETSWMRRPWPTGGDLSQNKQVLLWYDKQVWFRCSLNAMNSSLSFLCSSFSTWENGYARRTNAVWYRSSETYAQGPPVGLPQVLLEIKSQNYFIISFFVRLFGFKLAFWGRPNWIPACTPASLRFSWFSSSPSRQFRDNCPKLGHKNLLPYTAWRRCSTPA